MITRNKRISPSNQPVQVASNVARCNAEQLQVSQNINELSHNVNASAHDKTHHMREVDFCFDHLAGSFLPPWLPCFLEQLCFSK